GCAAKRRGMVSLVSTSEELINQVNMLLLNCGIHSSLSVKTKEMMNKYNGKIPFRYDCHLLEINSYESCKIFYETIGFRISRKQNRSSLIKKPKIHSGRKVIPFSRELVNTLVDSSGKTVAEMERKYNLPTLNS